MLNLCNALHDAYTLRDTPGLHYTHPSVTLPGYITRNRSV